MVKEQELWVKCEKCSKLIYKEDLENNLMVCPHCGYHFRIDAYKRIEYTLDPGSFREEFSRIQSVNPLGFKDTKGDYLDKVYENMKKTGLTEAVVVGTGNIYGKKVQIAVMDFRFLGGSMGSVVGEKVTLAAEMALKRKLPLIIFSASGGARMHEGILSLMQMAKTSAAIKRYQMAGGFYISVLTDPTTGGVTASFAMLGDIILAEPDALIGFAGPRVIEQTIKEKLPEGFQKAEFLQEHGFVDLVVERKNIKDTLYKLINYFKVNIK